MAPVSRSGLMSMKPKTMQFEQLVPPRNLTGELVARIRDEIMAGRFSDGGKLPTEQEMIASFGVSRSVVREAIAALKAEGLVETRQGAGAFVLGDKSRRPFRISPEGLLSIEGVLDILELRMGIEIESAGLAAERRSDGDLVQMRKALQAFEESLGRGEDAVGADFDFHRAVASATGNPYFVTLLDYLGWQIIPRRTVHVTAQNEPGLAAYLHTVLSEHQKIFRAIEAGNARAARSAMRRHLERGRERYVAFTEDEKGRARAPVPRQR